MSWYELETFEERLETDWLNALVAAVNSDNEAPDRGCSTAQTKALLAEAPARLEEHAALALADFDEAGDLPLGELRSDTVATGFTVWAGQRRQNVLVARMTVPAGPWPGHYGLEAVAFEAVRVDFPAWFPPVDAQCSLDFAHVVAASDGFARGQGTAVFPELLSLRKPLGRQAFGVVFLDKLVALYESRVLPVLAELGVGHVAEQDWPDVRQVAFLAHEWGHRSRSPIPYEETVHARRGRLSAVVSELYADLAALAMLLDQAVPAAARAAEVLLLDRIVREAWLPRSRSQVTSVVSRHLLAILCGAGLIRMAPTGVRLDVQGALQRLRQELPVLQEIESACLRGDGELAMTYLKSYGWRSRDDRYQIDLDEPSRLLESRATRLSGRLEDSWIP